MMRRFLPLALLSALGCGDQVAVVVTVDLDGALLGANDEITALTLVLTDGAGQSGVATFDDKGEPLTFPITLSSRVDAKRAGTDLRVGVAALDQNGRAILSGDDNLLVLNQDENLITIELNSDDPCGAGDGVDEGCCSDFLDNDGNGLADCLDQACADAFPDLCAGSVCGDGTTNPFAGELCDPGDPATQDNCNEFCVNNAAEAHSYLLYEELGLNDVDPGVSDMVYDSARNNPGFVVVQEADAGSSSCIKLNRQLNRIDDGAIFQALNFGNFQSVDGAGTVVNNATFNQLFTGINAGLFDDGEPMSLQLAAGSGFATPRVLFAGNAPTHFSVNNLLTFNGQANPNIAGQVTITRGADLSITWVPQGLAEDALLVLFTDAFSSYVICTAPDAEGELIVPATLTRSLPRGAFASDNTDGFFASFGYGFRQEILLDAAEADLFNSQSGFFQFAVVDGENVTGNIQ